MSFRNEPFRFPSPASAIDAVIAALDIDGVLQRRMAESVDLHAARGRFLAADVHADRDSPPFDYSVVDGYALRAADFAGPIGGTSSPHRAGAVHDIRVRVIGESRIGREPQRLPAHAGDVGPSAIRVSTGAPIPPGADVIVKREDVTEHSRKTGSSAGLIDRDADVTDITIPAATAGKLRDGENVRFAAENASSGAVILRAGEVLTSASLGALAAVGMTRPPVAPRVRVAILSTGDELADTDTAPAPFQIRDSNLPALSSLFASRPWIDVATAAHIDDDVPRLVGALTHARSTVDAIVLTGGVSMGHRDPVRAALELAFTDRLRILFHGMPQRPGKPMLGAVVARDGDRPLVIFGLPGNPVSALVTARRIALPVLAAAAGSSQASAPPRVAVASADTRTLDLWWHRPVRISPTGHATLVDLRGSGDLIACGQSHGFIEVPPNAPIVAADDASPSMFEYFAWDH